ncbi:hypothetical protein ER308_09855 [Egibacter rhizosphaerae]|uniref:Copper-containing nitrite reductase n=1 Tax=Egibacter rhizosphaerae TaxID=1670831 RepID=A0A411YF36_9ACTN|nr:multicopper oxidase domain-containing protein [Egibacter rhizosphaerae]QBI19830.1 hypothetical protein ER308_09855 [Egibacter rhizosphaerae]
MNWTRPGLLLAALAAIVLLAAACATTEDSGVAEGGPEDLDLPDTANNEGGADEGADEPADPELAANEGDEADEDGGDYVELDPNAAPGHDFEARDPRLDPAPEGDHHEMEIRATEMEQEVAPGVTQRVWGYNDQVPGPVIRGSVGDTFEITFINDGEMGHSIDFHASKVAPNEEMRTIQPGEELTYEFEAQHAGIFMYHCGTEPVLQHTAQGQHGAVIVDPPDLEPVDHEFWLVQHEYYFGEQGGIQDYDKMVDRDWDAVVFNGYPAQYAHEPIDDVEPGERVRVWLQNNGPSASSSFHVIGTIFDTVFKEGSYQLRPDEETEGGAQVLGLQASQGGFAEFTFDTDGVYPFVDHEFADMAQGAVGVFEVGDVDADEDGH